MAVWPSVIAGPKWCNSFHDTSLWDNTRSSGVQLCKRFILVSSHPDACLGNWQNRSGVKHWCWAVSSDSRPQISKVGARMPQFLRSVVASVCGFGKRKTCVSNLQLSGHAVPVPGWRHKDANNGRASQSLGAARLELGINSKAQKQHEISRNHNVCFYIMFYYCFCL